MEHLTLSVQYEQALVFALHLHRQQYRKGTGIPYFTHLMAVSEMVLEDGGNEDEAIAALLHDAVEDQGGESTLQEIKQRFGENVAAIVDGCTDTYQTPKPPWRERKEKYIQHLQSASESVKRVALADKLHNSRTILSTYRQIGEATWMRFNGGKTGTLWYYRTLVNVFREIHTSPMLEDFTKVVDELERLVEKNK